MGGDGHELLVGNDLGVQDRHRLAVLASRVIDCHEGAAFDDV